MTKLKLAILISGRGSNMQSILAAAQDTDYPLDATLILSNRPEAAGLEIAKAYNLKTAIVDHKLYGSDRLAFEKALNSVLVEHGVEVIALAGFMRILTPWFVQQWQCRLINIHPSLLPKYPGLYTHQRAIDAGDDQAGCSVHWVTEGVDEGQVIAQSAIAIEKDETAATLAAKILPLEHALYPRALAIAAKSIKLRGGSENSSETL